MDRLGKIDADELQRRLRAAYEQTIDDVAQAINDARDGHLINDSEERCRDVLGEFRRLAYETAAQMRVEAAEADPSFSPSGQCEARPGVPDGAQLQRAGPTAPASLPDAAKPLDQRAGG
jgi:hypothetical protein